MSADHAELRALLGAFAVGGVDDAERTRLQAHLDGCPACREELARLDRTARRLALVDPDRLGEREPPSDDLAEHLFARLATERRRRIRRTRVGAGLASAAAVVAAIVLVIALRPAPEADPPRTVVFTQAPPGVTATAELHEWRWGTQLYLEIQGLDANQRLAVWLEHPDGTRVPAGSFIAADGELHMRLGAGARVTDAVAVGVSDAQGDTLLLAPIET